MEDAPELKKTEEKSIESSPMGAPPTPTCDPTPNYGGSRSCPCKELEVLRWGGKKLWAFVFLFVLSFFVAGLLYILIVCGHNFNKGLFYVLNKEGFNGYFFAWSITLVTSSLVSYIHSLIFGHKEDGMPSENTIKSKCKYLWNNYITVILYKHTEDKKKVLCSLIKSLIVYVWGIVMLCIAFVLYVRYSNMVNSDLESAVESIKIEKLVGDDFLREKHKIYTTDSVNKKIDSVIPTIDTKEFVDRIDKEALKKALVRYNYEIVNPPRHVNPSLICLCLCSLFYSIVVFCLTYPNPDN